MQEPEQTLSEIWKNINQQLTRAINDRKHPFRIVVIGSMGAQAVNMRNVVLRKFQKTPFTLTCYTDIRSQKIQELQANPHLTWLFWHPRHQIQIKAVGKVEIIHQTNETRQTWKQMHIGAKVAYLTRSAPSTPQTIPTNGLPENILALDEANLSDENFAVIRCEISEIEYLRLNKMQHRRARFELKNGKWEGNWLVP